MQIKEYLENYQPVINQTFINAIRDDKLSHAYLLSGSTGMPLKECAIFLAKSILCDNPSPLACNECMTCLRIDEGNYPDVMIMSGDESKIKKSDVEKIINNFDKSALESKGIMIYILHLVENMTEEAVNSLLKFLEEPGRNIFAFLTTENETKILPTILSRTQILKFKTVSRDKVVNDALNEGIDAEDAQILSAFYSDPQTIKNISQDDKYISLKSILKEQLQGFVDGKDAAIFINQRKVIPFLKDSKEQTRLYIKMLGEVFRDIENKRVGEEITLKCYDEYISELANKIANTDKLLTIILSATSKLDINVNASLLLDHIIYKITREVK